MGEFLEVLLEGVLEFIVDVSDTAATSKSAPAPLRILAAVLIFCFFGGAFGGLIFAGVMLIKDGDWIFGVICFAIAALIMWYLIHKFRKIFNSRRG